MAPGGLQLWRDLPGGVALKAFFGRRWARDASAQLFQRLAVVGATANGLVQVASVHAGAQRVLEVHLPWRRALQLQHLLAGSRAEGDAVIKWRGLGRPERVGLVRIGIVVSHLGPTPLFHRYALTGEQLHHPGDDLVQRRLQRLVGRRGCLDEFRRAVAAAPVHAVRHHPGPRLLPGEGARLLSVQRQRPRLRRRT